MNIVLSRDDLIETIRLVNSYVIEEEIPTDEDLQLGYTIVHRLEEALGMTLEDALSLKEEQLVMINYTIKKIIRFNCEICGGEWCLVDPDMKNHHSVYMTCPHCEHEAKPVEVGK